MRGELSWQTDALCAQIGGDEWFPEKGELARQARAICAACPVRLQCLEYALKNEEYIGIWGGLSGPQIRKARRSQAA